MTRTDKAKATREKTRSQIVTINDEWRIQRIDPLNWEIQYKGDGLGYYPNVSGALRALPAKMLNEEARGTLTDIHRSVEGISAMIDKAIP